MEQPNILLIVTDQWRGDCIGMHGHPAVDTPNIDNLFQHGTGFSAAYSSVPSCIAARAALLTGLSQRTHGRVGYRDRVDWNYDVTLPGLLADAGYHTHCAGKMHVFPSRNLMGFHSVDLCDGYLHNERERPDDNGLVDDYLPWLRENLGGFADITDAGVGCNGYSVTPWPYEERFHMTNWVTMKSLEFLKRRDPRKPFFLKTSYHRPHPPLDPPQAYLDRYLNRELPPVAMGDWAADELPPSRGFDSPVPRTPAQIDLARRAYYAQLTHIDKEINRLCHGLVEHNLTQNTLIIFTSDHGDMLYDHNMVAKGMPYTGSSRVPLLVRFPGAWGDTAVRTNGAPVELRDILPTCCDAAGIPVPDSVEGKSVLPFCRGEEPAWREYIHGEHFRGRDSNHWLTDGNMMYVWFSQSGKEQLFDLKNDPQNMHDLAPDHPEEVDRWRKRLVAELDGREEGYVKNGMLITGRPAKTVLDHVRAEAR